VHSSTIQLADRIKDLPPYLFAAIDRMKQEALRQGKDIINLGVGDPDLPTPAPIIQRLKKAADDPRHHQYPSYEGMLSFRQAVADWYRRRFQVTLDPATEVLTLIGSKEGIGHFPLAFINPGDVALMTSPGYPVYHAGTLFAGGRSWFLPLREENGFLPDLSAIPNDALKAAKILFINSPNNPTSAVADAAFFKGVVAFAHQHQIIVCHDAAYSEIYYDGQRPLSFLSVDGAKEVGVEFHSLSKTFNMTGWRIGFVVGNAEVVAGLGKIKSNLDSGVFQAIQEAGIAALSMEDADLSAIRKIYQERRDVLIPGLRRLGFRVTPPPASFYTWIRTPDGVLSSDLTARLISEAAIVSTPGSGFGEAGEGYIRMTLTVSADRMEEAIARMTAAGIHG
jgi:LL-diaminopimelate aminotransferase